MKQHILVTGATGLIGRKLIKSLKENGHELSILSRKPVQMENVRVFLWDVANGEIDPACIQGVDVVIHLAGEGIAAQKWTAERKQQIIDSRVQSAALLYKLIRETNAPVKKFISAAAVGFYGNRGEEILTEESGSGAGFLAESCRLWEAAVEEGKSLNIKIIKLRIGIILAKEGGALEAMDKPIRFFAGAPLGTGKQWMPWVHIDDIVAMFSSAAATDLYEGAYNACAPFPVTNTTMTRAIAKKLSRPVWPFHVPEFALKLILGEMSEIVTISNNASAQKLLDTGFKFKYLQLEDALTDIYGS